MARYNPGHVQELISGPGTVPNFDTEPSEFRLYSGGKNKPAKPHFPYKIGIFESHFKDKNVEELLSSFKDQSRCIR